MAYLTQASRARKNLYNLVWDAGLGIAADWDTNHNRCWRVWDALGYWVQISTLDESNVIWAVQAVREAA